MSRTQFVYSSDLRENIIPVVYSKRADAPERGEVFSSLVIRDPKKKDLVIKGISNHTGYVRKNLEDGIVAEEGKYYRFMVVAGPFCKDHHNFFYAIPQREISNGEDRGLNRLNPQTSLLIERLGEFLLGLGWDRRKKKHYLLTKYQKRWEWFCKNFM